VENSVHYTGKPLTPLEKASQSEAIQAQEAALESNQENVAEANEIDQSASKEDATTEPIKPVE
jgi:gamma-glutamyl phosphate reductase